MVEQSFNIIIARHIYIIVNEVESFTYKPSVNLKLLSLDIFYHFHIADTDDLIHEHVHRLKTSFIAIEEIV